MEETEPITVAEGIERWLRALEVEGERTKRTLSSYWHVAGYFAREFGSKPAADVTMEEISNYLGSRRVSVPTRRKERRVLSSLFGFLHTRGLIPRNPIKAMISPKARVRRIAESEWLTPEELERFLGSLKGYRARVLALVGARTGVRAETLETLDWPQVNLEEKYLDVIEKGRKPRRVYFNDEVRDALVKLKQRWKHRIGMARRHLHRNFEQARRDAEISKPVHPLSLRHTFACHSRLRGMPIEDLCDLMGHENINTTMVYANVGRTELERAYRRVWDQG